VGYKKGLNSDLRNVIYVSTNSYLRTSHTYLQILLLKSIIVPKTAKSSRDAKFTAYDSKPSTAVRIRVIGNDKENLTVKL
jgi:hypothetical protein